MKISFAHLPARCALTLRWVRNALDQWFGTDNFISPCTEFVTLVLVDDEPVGFHAFRLGTRKKELKLRSLLTFVRRGHRGQGLGAKLWAESQRWTGATYVVAFAVTKAGAGLVERLKRTGTRGDFDCSRVTPTRLPRRSTRGLPATLREGRARAA